jgi:hypothetical protein
LELLPLPIFRTAKVRPEDCTEVTVIEWEGATNVPSLFSEKIAAIKGQKLTAPKFVELLTTFANAPGTNASGLVLQARKDDDLTGVLISLRLLSGIHPAPNTSLRINQRVTLGGDNLLSSAGGGSFEHYASPKGWEDFAQAANKALAAPPTTPFVLNARIATDE